MRLLATILLLLALEQGAWAAPAHAGIGAPAARPPASLAPAQLRHAQLASFESDWRSVTAPQAAPASAGRGLGLGLVGQASRQVRRVGLVEGPALGDQLAQQRRRREARPVTRL